MEAKNKKTYEAPSMRVSEVMQKSVICASGGDYPVWEPEDI